MRVQTVQIAALIAAVAFTLAFIAAGMFLLSMVFVLIGAGAVAWLTYHIARRVLEHRRARALTIPR